MFFTFSFFCRVSFSLDLYLVFFCVNFCYQLSSVSFLCIFVFSCVLIIFFFKLRFYFLFVFLRIENFTFLRLLLSCAMFVYLFYSVSLYSPCLFVSLTFLTDLCLLCPFLFLSYFQFHRKLEIGLLPSAVHIYQIVG